MSVHLEIGLGLVCRLDERPLTFSVASRMLALERGLLLFMSWGCAGWAGGGLWVGSVGVLAFGWGTGAAWVWRGGAAAP